MANAENGVITVNGHGTLTGVDSDTETPDQAPDTVTNLLNGGVETPHQARLAQEASAENGVITVNGDGPFTGVDSGTETPDQAPDNVTNLLNGGVIIDVETPHQARLAQEAGACAVIVLENFAADIRHQHVISRMTDPQIIKDIKNSVTIPVFAKTRIGHIAEAQILEQIGVDFIDESEVLTPADQEHHIDKYNFRTPFICGSENLGEALRRVNEGAVIIRTKGGAGTGNVVEAIRQLRSIGRDIQTLINMNDIEVLTFSNNISAPYELVLQTKRLRMLPAMLFGAGGIATPADAVLVMQFGCHGVIVGSGIFKSPDPVTRARAIVQAVKHCSNPGVLAEVSSGLGEAMVGIISENENVDRND